MTNWSGQRVLVTGAGGFIGSHLVEALAAEGARVRAFVHYNSLGSRGWLDGSAVRDDVEVVAGDVRDRDILDRATDGMSVVFHLAALIAIPYSYHAPESYVQTNVLGTLNLLQSSRRNGVHRVVHTSTSEVYGTARSVPIDEAHPLQAQSPYAASKIGADKIAEAFHASFGLSVVTVRPFNTFGPRQSARAVVPTIITQLLAGKAVRLGNLHPTRDLNFVSNQVDGFLRAADSETAAGQTFNLGSGRETGIGDLAALIGRLMGREVRLERDSDRERPVGSEVDRLLADSRRAEAELGWRARVTLEEGLRRTIEWMESHREKYRPESYAL